MNDFRIKLIKSSFLDEVGTKAKLCEFISSADMLSMSNECKKFEENFAKKQERKYAVFVNSGSSANLLLVQALLNSGRLRKGDRVGFSAVTWATNVMPIIQLGLVPVPIDIEINTLNISSSTLSDLAPSLNALFLTNVLGFSSDLRLIGEICDKNNVILLEDNCESLGSKVGGKFLGNFGLASTFSFFAGHHISTIEGGMVCTDDHDLWKHLIMARAHGWDRDLNIEEQKQIRSEHSVSDFYSLYTFYYPGFNLRPTEIQGFLGNVQIKFWDFIVSTREKNFFRFFNAARQNKNIVPINVAHMDVVSNFAMPLIFKGSEAYAHYLKKFMEAGVQVRPIIAGDIMKQPFFKKYGEDLPELKNSIFVHKYGFYFPNNPELDEIEINILCNLLK